MPEHDFLGAPQLHDDDFIPQIYDIFGSPFIIKSSQNLLEYELQLQNLPDQHQSWSDYIDSLNDLQLDKEIRYKKFDRAPKGWRNDLFGNFVPVTSLLRSAPQVMN